MPFGKTLLITHLQRVGELRDQVRIAPADVQRVGVIHEGEELKEVRAIYPTRITELQVLRLTDPVGQEGAGEHAERK